jgi:hypothetical protein
MKIRTLTLALGTALVLAGAGSARAQLCTPSTSACALQPQVYFGAVCFTPDPLPSATVGQDYNEAIKFVSIDTVTVPLTLPLTKVEILSVRMKLPNGQLVPIEDVGLAVTYISGNAVDNPTIDSTKAFTPVQPANGFGPFGCIAISGVPTQPADSIDLVARINDAIVIPSAITNDIPIRYKFTISPAPCAVVVEGTTTATGCTTATGVVTVSASGGTAPYQYRLSGNQTFQTSNVFDNLEAGTYTVLVRDANQCVGTGSFTVATAARPTATATPTQPACFGERGSAVLAGAGGQQPYTYSLNGEAFTAASERTNLAAGTYTFLVRDAAGCLSDTGRFSITIPAELGLTLAQNTTGCTGGNTNVVVTATGGTPPYTYSADGQTFQAGATLACLAPGGYSITVKDANGCTALQTLTITTDRLARRYTAVRVYPNPVVGSRFTVELTGVSAREVHLGLTDAQGRMVWKQTLPTRGTTFTADVPITGLAAGTYHLSAPALGLNHAVVIR